MTAAVRLRVGAELRARWLAWLGVAVVVGIGGGVVLIASTAAHRSERAYPRFSESQHAADTLVVGRSAFLFVGNVDTTEVAHLPAVSQSARASVVLLFAGRTDTGRSLGPADVFPIVAPDRELGSEMERWRILEGRRARPGAVDEVTVSFLAAERLGLHVGSRLRIRFVEADQFVPVAVALLGGFEQRLRADTVPQPVIDELAKGPTVDFHVVGVEASPAEFPPLGDNIAPPIHLTPAFAARYRGELVESPLLYVRLRRGAEGLTSFASDVERLGAGAQTSLAFRRPVLTDAVQRATRIEAWAARAMAALVGVALVAVIAQFLSRLGGRDLRDREALRSVGMTGGQILATAAVRALVIGVTGAALAVAMAWGLSALTPVGLARKADLHTGMRFDGPIFGLGAVGLVLVCVLVGVVGSAWSARRADTARRVRPSARPSRLTRAVEAMNLPPTVAMGARFAFAPPTASRSVPLRSAAAGLGVAVAIVAGTATFVTNLNRLLDTPARYGWTWDVEAGAPGLPGLIAEPLVAALRKDDSIGEFAGGTVSELFLRSPGGGIVRSDVLALRQHQGTVAPTMLEGRVPSGTDEIVLGTNTLDSLGLRVGDRVVARVGERRARMTIVGRAIVPGLGEAGGSGSRAYLPFAGFRRLLPGAEENVFLIRFAPGVDHERAFAEVKAALDPVPTLQAVRPSNLSPLARIRSLPALLVGLLAVIALVTLIGTLASSIRRRRREIGLLRAMGLRRRQVTASLLWEATGIVAAAVVIGGPIGAAIGRAAWAAFADAGGLATDAIWPSPRMLLGVVALFLVADIVVLVAARSAGRDPPAVALRTE